MFPIKKDRADAELLSEEEIKKNVKKDLTFQLKETKKGKSLYHIIDFLKKAEAEAILYQFLEALFTDKEYSMTRILQKIIHISDQRREKQERKVTIEMCQDITFDKGFYLETIWNSMGLFLGFLMRERNFELNRETDTFLNYMREILALAWNGIITPDTLIEVEERLLVDFSEEDALEILEFALNITDYPLINPEYLFIKLEENIENPIAVLHRGKKNYELLFENELGMLQKMEIKNPTREKIKGYIPIRTLFLHGEFIGKRLGDKDILFLYEGFYFAIDSVGNAILYKKEYVKESEFTTGDISLGNLEDYLIWLDDKANEKYKSLLEEKEMRKKKRKE